MNSLFDKTVCLSVTFHKAGCIREGSMNNIETEADKNELGLRKRIFSSENYTRCRWIIAQAQKWLRKRSVPSPLRGGTYLIPVPLVDSVNEYLDGVVTEYNESVEAFIVEYPSLIKQWQDKLKDQYDARNYPTPQVMRRRFGVNRMVLNFSPARPDEIDQRNEIEQAVEEIRAALRCGLLELIERMTEMLGDEEGKRKRFSSKALESFKEWMELFPARLVVDDDELQKLAERAMKVMEGKSVDDLRDPGKVREQTRAGLGKIGVQLQKLVKDMPKRAFGFDDE